LAYLLVLPGSRARIVRCGGCYDPQLVKRSSEWVSDPYTLLSGGCIITLLVVCCINVVSRGLARYHAVR